MQPVPKLEIVEPEKINVPALLFARERIEFVLDERDEHEIQLQHSPATAPTGPAFFELGLFAMFCMIHRTIVGDRRMKLKHRIACYDVGEGPFSRATVPMNDSERQFVLLTLAGRDAASFLQGYVTADIDAIAPAHALPTAFTDIKGRVTASGWLWGTADHVRILLHASVAQSQKADLAKYLMFSKAEWLDDGIARFVRADDPDAAVSLPPTEFAIAVDHTDRAAGDDTFYRGCVEAGMIVVTEAIAGRFLPQSLGLTAVDAVSFNKGCYLGQEIVARAEHRGRIKVGLARFTTPATPLATGAALFVDEKNVGTVLASTQNLTLAATRHDGPQQTADGLVLEIER